jgi:hypothetical protein
MGPAAFIVHLDDDGDSLCNSLTVLKDFLMQFEGRSSDILHHSSNLHFARR